MHSQSTKKTTASAAESERMVRIVSGDATLQGGLIVPPHAIGVVLFAHGSGSSRHSPRNVAVAAELRRGGLATLLIDLLTRQEEAADIQTGQFRFDIPLLSQRVVDAVQWISEQASLRDLPIACFGASTGAAAALVAAAARPGQVAAVVSRGGRPDLVIDALPMVQAPTLLIVGQRDPEVLKLNRAAMAHMRCETKLVIVPEATHLFEEPGALGEVARLAREWIVDHFSSNGTPMHQEVL